MNPASFREISNAAQIATVGIVGTARVVPAATAVKGHTVAIAAVTKARAETVDSGSIHIFRIETLTL